MRTLFRSTWIFDVSITRHNTRCKWIIDCFLYRPVGENPSRRGEKRQIDRQIDRQIEREEREIERERERERNDDDRYSLPFTATTILFYSPLRTTIKNQQEFTTELNDSKHWTSFEKTVRCYNSSCSSFQSVLISIVWSSIC